MTKAKGLGRGLSSLMGENSAEITNNELNHILIEHIQANPNQPRALFSANELDELANSIRHNGVLQPILLRKIAEDQHQIIAGERRWRAAKLAGLDVIPAIIKDLQDNELLEIALVENIQRENLSPLEEAEGYRRLIDECLYTQEKMASIVCKSRSHIANLLRLLSLPSKVKQYLGDGEISLGHAKLLVNQKAGEHLADIIISNKLNVRETEELIREQNGFQSSKPGNSNKPRSPPKDSDTIAVEASLSEALGLMVTIEHFMNGGRISVNFQNLEQLDSVIKRLNKSIN